MWAFIFIFSAWILMLFLGVNLWIVGAVAGAFACVSLALMGIIFSRMPRVNMFGLCWKSPVPAGLRPYPVFASAAVILGERYRHAVALDQRQPAPVLWSLSRVFDRRGSNIERKVDLMDRRFPSKKFKSEMVYRLKVMPVLFLITALLACLLEWWLNPYRMEDRLLGNESSGRRVIASNGTGPGGKSSETGNSESASQPGASSATDSSSPNAKSEEKVDKESTGGSEGGGTGQGKGDPNHTPEMRKEPVPLPDFPSRETPMVKLELPAVGPGEGSDEEPGQDKTDKSKAGRRPPPPATFKTGSQDRDAFKPDQVIPNWIWALIPPKNPDKIK